VIEHSKTTPYHPQCNGAVEKLNGTLKRGSTKQIQAGIDWVDSLLLVLYSIRLHDHDRLGMSLFELVHGHKGRTELDVIYAGINEGNKCSQHDDSLKKEKIQL